MALRPTQWRDPAVLAVTGLGAGFLPGAPGTWGSVAALGVWWVLSGVLGATGQLVAIVAVGLGGVWLAGRVARRHGVHDDPAIVIDEFAGMWLTLWLAPRVWWVFLLGFGLFRLFDVAKPWPVSWADRHVSGGLGVMLDDLVAGLMAAIVLQVSILVMS